MLTLFTTPVIYLYFDRLAQRFQRKTPQLSDGPTDEPASEHTP